MGAAPSFLWGGHNGSRLWGGRRSGYGTLQQYSRQEGVVQVKLPGETTSHKSLKTINAQPLILCGSCSWRRRTQGCTQGAKSHGGSNLPPGWSFAQQLWKFSRTFLWCRVGGWGEGRYGANVVGFKKHLLSAPAWRQQAAAKEKRGTREPFHPPAMLPCCWYWQAAG